MCQGRFQLYKFRMPRLTNGPWNICLRTDYQLEHARRPSDSASQEHAENFAEK